MQSPIHDWVMFTPKLLFPKLHGFPLIRFVDVVHEFVMINVLLKGDVLYAVMHVFWKLVSLKSNKKSIRIKTTKFPNFFASAARIVTSRRDAVIDIIFPIRGNRKSFEAFPDRKEG